MAAIAPRLALLALIALCAVGLVQLAPTLRPASAVADARAIAWSDLVPEGADGPSVPTANNLIADPLIEESVIEEPAIVATGRLMDGAGAATHGLSLAPEARESPTDGSLNGERVALSGYMTPFSFDEDRVRAFLLVPYVGACIHVPPPPPNQIVLVESDEPVPVLAMWEPMTAVGTLGVEQRSTDLAEVGYTMRLERMETYESDAENS